jgi:hypothetical protein
MEASGQLYVPAALNPGKMIMIMMMIKPTTMALQSRAR